MFWLSAAVYSRQFDSVLMRSVAVLILLAAFLAIAFAFWINRRQALIVVRGYHYKDDLATLRPYIREYRPVLIACASGRRAVIAASRLTSQGYDVRVMNPGGIPDLMSVEV